MQGESEPIGGTPIASTGWTLFAVFGGPLAWVVHFLGSYALVGIGCAARWDAIRPLVAIGTALLAAVAAVSLLAAWRGWRRASGGQSLLTALGEPRGWFAFLMLTGVLLGGLALFTILLEGFGSAALRECGWWR